MRLVEHAAAKFELYELDEREQTIEQLDCSDRGNIATIRSVCGFYLKTGRLEAVGPLLETVVKGGVPCSTGDQEWARQSLAYVLSATTDFARFRQALDFVGVKLDEEGRLVREKGDDIDSTDSIRAKGRVLATQPQAQFRNRAVDLLEQLDLHDVMVIRSSLGGWIAAVMAVRDTTRLSSIVLVDSAGIQVEGHPIADVFPLTPDELSALSYHNPAAFRIDPTTLSPERVAAVRANFQALKVYDQGQGMHDLKLRRRLGRVRIPALVVWGESDGVVDPDYGRAYAQALPNARFELIPEAGHLPQIEQPARLLKVIWEFADSIPSTPSVVRSSEEH